MSKFSLLGQRRDGTLREIEVGTAVSWSSWSESVLGLVRGPPVKFKLRMSRADVASHRQTLCTPSISLKGPMRPLACSVLHSSTPMYEHLSPQELYQVVAANEAPGAFLVSSFTGDGTQNGQNAATTPPSTPGVLSETSLNGLPVWVCLSDLDPAFADRWALTAGWHSQFQDVQTAHMAQNSSGGTMYSFQSSPPVFDAAQLPAVPSEHQVCFRYLQNRPSGLYSRFNVKS